MMASSQGFTAVGVEPPPGPNLYMKTSPGFLITVNLCQSVAVMRGTYRVAPRSNACQGGAVSVEEHVLNTDCSCQ